MYSKISLDQLEKERFHIYFSLTEPFEIIFYESEKQVENQRFVELLSEIKRLFSGKILEAEWYLWTVKLIKKTFKCEHALVSLLFQNEHVFILVKILAHKIQ